MCTVTLQRGRRVSYIFLGCVCIGEVSPSSTNGFILTLYRIYWRGGWPNRVGGYPCIKIPRLRDSIPSVLDALHRLSVVDREGYYAL